MKKIAKMKVLFFCFLVVCFPAGAKGDNAPEECAGPEPVYVVVMNHVEGDDLCPVCDAGCLQSIKYQTGALPDPGKMADPSYAVDIVGNDLIFSILQNFTDSFGRKPKLFIEPTGEWWQTYADPTFGGKAFDRYNYPALDNEFGIQGHPIYYSGIDFGWLESPHTEYGITRKLQDVHYFAERAASYDGHKVNAGKTYSGGWKAEKDFMDGAVAEYAIDHAAYALGYRISFEDHDGHIKDEPAGINNLHPSPYVYRAIYDDGVHITKIDMNGGITGLCPENPEGWICEKPEQAKARFERTLLARASDPDRRKVYYFAFAVHSNWVWDDFNLAAVGFPFIGEGFGLKEIMGYMQARVNNGAKVKFVTPMELAVIFNDRNPVPFPAAEQDEIR